jgi:cytochrome c peroxidase
LAYDNLAKAIGAFERKLVTVSRWDAYSGRCRSPFRADADQKSADPGMVIAFPGIKF